MSAKYILDKIKAIFDAPQAPQPTAIAPAPTTTATMISAYPVDGAQAVYVDNSDDGIADLDEGDKVYVDPAQSAPYPDGTYNVTGTTFGFTVTGGAISAVNDPTGAGPGQPIDPTALAAPAAPPAVPVNNPTASTTNSGSPLTLSLEERVAAIEAALAKLTPPAVTCTMATEEDLKKATDEIVIQKSELAAQKIELDKNTAVIKEFFTLLEGIVKVPVVAPATLNGNQKERFDRTNQKEKKFAEYAASLEKMKNEKKY